MSNQPLVSVIIPTYKRSRRLAGAIESALNQTHGAIEVIVVDDNGQDNPWAKKNEDLVKGYGRSNLIFIQHPVNQGASAARNTGITAARGEYIAFLDDDDRWLPDKIEKQVAVIKALPDDYAVVDTGFESIGINDKVKVVLPKLSGFIYQDLLVKHRGRAPKLSTVLCRKKVLIEVGLFDPALPARQDLDLYLRIARTYKFYNLNEPLAVISKNSPDRISGSLKKRIEGHDIFYIKYLKDLKKAPQIHSIYLQKHGNLLLRDGSKKQALKKYLNSFRVYPLNIQVLFKYFLVLFGLK